MSEELPIVEIFEDDEVSPGEKELAAVEEREAGSREQCFEMMVQLCPALNEAERQAIRRDMARGKSRAWSAYNGHDVKLTNVTVVDGLIRARFEMDKPKMQVDEIVIV